MTRHIAPAGKSRIYVRAPLVLPCRQWQVGLNLHENQLYYSDISADKRTVLLKLKNRGGYPDYWKRRHYTGPDPSPRMRRSSSRTTEQADVNTRICLL